MLWIKTSCLFESLSNPELLNQYATYYEGQLRKHIELEIVFDDQDYAEEYKTTLYDYEVI